MPRIDPLAEAATPAETRIAYHQHKAIYNARITNMKATLGHSYTAFQAYMQWYPLYEEVKRVLGDRLAPLYAWSISEASDCPLCSTYFRKVIIESGQNPEALDLNDQEQAVLTFGATIAARRGFVPDEVYRPLIEHYADKAIVILTAFAGIMIATNIFNNVIHTEIDDYLHPFVASPAVLRERQV